MLQLVSSSLALFNASFASFATNAWCCTYFSDLQVYLMLTCTALLLCVFFSVSAVPTDISAAFLQDLVTRRGMFWSVCHMSG